MPEPKRAIAKPPDAAQIKRAIRRGIDFLLGDQNKDGSWGSAQRTKGLNIYAPVPGAHQAFRAAVTALCVNALIEVDDGSERTRLAIDRGEKWLLERVGKVRRATPMAIYNVWTHAYAISALASMHTRHAGDAAMQAKIAEAIKVQMELLERYESIDGGWGYYDFRAGTKRPASSSISFTTATALVAFHDAKQIGIEPPAKVVKRAADAIRRQMKPDFTYLYGEYLRWRPMWGINLPGGSLGRSQACNLALRLWGEKRITDEVMIHWLDKLIDRNLWLDMARKRPIPHESHFMVAAYFFYYGHYYAARCVEQLPAEGRGKYQGQLAGILLPLEEKDGSWWDFPFYNYHQQYGTAFALLSLRRCQGPPEEPVIAKSQ